MKTLRLYIAKPEKDLTWKEAGVILRNLQYDTAKILNFAMNNWFSWQHGKEALKNQNGKYPTLKEYPAPNNTIYRDARKMFPEINSRMVAAIVQKANLKWKSDCKEVFYSQQKSLSTFKKTTPVIIDKQAFTVEKTDNGYIFYCSLFSKNREGQKRFIFMLNTKKIQNSQKQILNKLISGEWKRGAAQIGFNKNKNKWFINFAYEPLKKETFLNPEIIVGIDLGVSKSFYCAVNNTKQRLCADGFEIENFREKLKKRKISILRQGPFSGRKGRGRKNILKPTDKIGDKERRFRDTRYHQYSKMIIDFAVKNKAGVIQLEDLASLKELKKNNFILKNWALADLQLKIEYKAKEQGISIVYINPMFTSQRCSKCGDISSENRKDQKTFNCVNCGHSENADYNAACNIATKNIEEIIANHNQVDFLSEVRAN